MPFLDAEATMAKFAATQTAVIEPPAPTEALAPIEITADALKLAHLQSRETAQPVATGYGVAEVPDLRQLVVDRVNLMGKAEAAVSLGRSLKVIESWVTGKASPGIDDLQKILQRPSKREERDVINILGRIDLEDGEITVQPERPRMPVMVCMPIKGECSALIMASLFALGARYAPHLSIQAETLLVRSRNLLTDRFLRSNLPWSFWLDSDVLMPMGSDVFQRVTNPRKLGSVALSMDALPRLIGHGKPIVGGVYASRAAGGQLVIAPDLTPRDDADIELSNRIRENHEKGLHQVRWIAAGATLIHRDVFMKVREVFKDRVQVDDTEPFPFWNPQKSEGEDIAFSARVAEAGFPMFIDTELVLGHRGTTWYLPEHSAPARRLS